MSLGQLTLGALRTLIRQRSNMESSQSVTDSELNSSINGSYQELYGKLVQVYGNDYFVQTPYTFTTDGVTNLYPLPSDFFKLLGVDLALSPASTQFMTVKPFNMPSRNRLNNPFLAQAFGPASVSYRLSGNNLWLTPLPQGGLTVQLLYVPRCPQLTLDSDVLDGVNGWEEYIIIDVVIKWFVKLDFDISTWGLQKQFQIARLKDEAESRDCGISHTVSDGIFGYPWEMG